MKVEQTALPPPVPASFRCFCPVGFSPFPPRPLPPLGVGGAQGWLGAGSVIVVALRLCTLRPGLAQGRR